LLERKPGALRNGLPFIEGKWPEPIQRVNDILREKYNDWAKQMTKILSLIRIDGLDMVMLACQRAIDNNIVTESTATNHIMRLREEPKSPTVEPPDELKLDKPIEGDLNHYDNLYREVPDEYKR
jgi:hypothetical protein